MNRYEKGKIYKITDIGLNKVYVGSTCEKISQRMVRHRSNYKSHLSGCYGRNSLFDLFDEFGVDNCKIYLIENFPCQSKEELLKREGELIQELACVNKLVMGRPATEYRNQPDVKERRKEYNKEYREKTLNKLNEYDKAKYQRLKEERSKKVECPLCQKMIRCDWIKAHQRTQKCQSFKQIN